MGYYAVHWGSSNALAVNQGVSRYTPTATNNTPGTITQIRDPGVALQAVEYNHTSDKAIVVGGQENGIGLYILKYDVSDDTWDSVEIDDDGAIGATGFYDFAWKPNQNFGYAVGEGRDPNTGTQAGKVYKVNWNGDPDEIETPKDPILNYDMVGHINAIDFRPNGSYMILGGDFGRLWKLDPNTEAFTDLGMLPRGGSDPKPSITDIDWRNDDEATITGNGVIWKFTEPDTFERVYGSGRGFLWGMDWTPNGNHGLAVGKDGQVFITTNNEDFTQVSLSNLPSADRTQIFYGVSWRNNYEALIVGDRGAYRYTVSSNQLAKASEN